MEKENVRSMISCRLSHIKSRRNQSTFSNSNNHAAVFSPITLREAITDQIKPHP